jgi:hypothetical protein
MANRGAVVARIVSEYSDKGTKAATKDFKKLSEDSSGFGKQFEELGKKIGKAFAVVEIAKFGFEAIKTAEAVNGAFSKMNLAFAASGSSLNSNSEEVKKAVDQMAGLAFTSTETADALARGAIIFHSANAAMNNLGLAANVARATGMSLTDAMLTLGRAAEGKTSKALTSLGVVIPKTGTAAEKYKIITDQLTKSLQGQADAYAQTHPIEAMKAKFEELSNSIGQLLLPVFNAVVKIIDNYVIPAVLGVVNFLRENPKYLQPFADAWADIVNIFAKVAGVFLIIEAAALRLDSILLQVVRGMAWLTHDKGMQDWAKKAADGLGSASKAVNDAGHKLLDFHMTATKLTATNPIVVKTLADLSKQNDVTATSTSKLTAAQIASIDALKKMGVTVKDQQGSDPIELEAARQLLIKQGNVAEQERVQALIDSTNAQNSANNAAARYTDLLAALADSHISSEEVALLANKWGISQNAVVAYIAQVTGAAAFDPKELGSPAAVAAQGWTSALAELNKYYDGLKNPPQITIPTVVPSTGGSGTTTPANPSTTTQASSILSSLSSAQQSSILSPELYSALSNSTANFGANQGAGASGGFSSVVANAMAGNTTIIVQGNVQTKADNVASIRQDLLQGQLSGKSVNFAIANL